MKKATNGYFDLVGMIKGFGSESFKKDIQGTNNQNWVYNRLSVMLTDGAGKNLYVNMQDGYDRLKGKTIFVQSQDDKNLQIAFGDRFNEGLRAVIKDNSFLKVATGKVKVEAKDRETGETIIENGVPKMIEVWDYKRFLTLYDMTLFLADKLTDGLKVRMTGQIKFREYNGNTQREFVVQKVFFLPENDDTKCEFKVTQTVIVDENSIDDSRLELDNMIKIRSKLYQKKNKEEMMVTPLELVCRTTPEKVEQFKKAVETLYRVDGDTLRKITLNCVINSGYVQAEVTPDTISPEIQEMLDAGLMTEEQVKGSYTSREKVDELLVISPVVKNGIIDKDDTYYVKEDLENLIIKREDNGVVERQEIVPQVPEFNELDLDKELGLC